MLAHVRDLWSSTQATQTLCEYIRIPNLSPSFDTPHSIQKGFSEQALGVLTRWIETNFKPNDGISHRVIRLQGRTPLLLVEAAARGGARAKEASPVLMYGHWDKQPPCEGWDEGLEPYSPVIRGSRLYGRGGADDGYSTFAALTALGAIHRAGKEHPKVVVMLEGSEESGSPDLMAYVEGLKDVIGVPGLVVCLDSGAGDYERLWITSSLRGVVVGDLKTGVLREGVHSGDASGIVPSSFRVARALLSRLEDPLSGIILPSELNPEIPLDVKRRVSEAATHLGQKGMVSCFPFLEGVQPPLTDVSELALNRWWRPQMEVIGADGIPSCASAGNVLRPFTTLTLSLRLPPNLDKKTAEACLAHVLTEKPIPHGAHAEFKIWKSSQGWSSPPVAPWLDAALDAASKNAFDGRAPVFHGEGGSIPFMSMLGSMFPSTQFFVTGVLGPGANAHGPNEFLELDFCQRVTACVADVLVAAACVTTSSSLSSSSSPTKKLKS